MCERAKTLQLLFFSAVDFYSLIYPKMCSHKKRHKNTQKKTIFQENLLKYFFANIKNNNFQFDGSLCLNQTEWRHQKTSEFVEIFGNLSCLNKWMNMSKTKRKCLWFIKSISINKCELFSVEYLLLPTASKTIATNLNLTLKWIVYYVCSNTIGYRLHRIGLITWHGIIFLSVWF